MARRVRLAAMLAMAAASMGRGEIAGVSEQRAGEIAAMLPAAPAGLGKPCSDRSAWGPLAPTLQRFVTRGEELLEGQFPGWDDGAYLDYGRTGTRVRGDRMMASRLAWLAPLVLAECAEGRGRFLPRVSMVLDELALQKSWTLAAHDPKLDSYSGRRYFVDLHAAGLAHAMAEALYLLGDRLPADTRRRSIDALHKRILDPMRDSYAKGSGQTWLRVTSNWNPVCLAGVTGTALALIANRRERTLFVAAAEHYSAFFLDSFLNDGYALEGIGYWAYGFSRFALLREELWGATGGKLDLFRHPKAQRAAVFGSEFQMLPGNYAAFGDARFLTPRPDALISYLERTLGLAPSSNASPSVGESLEAEVLARFPNPSSLERAEAAQRGAGDLRTFYADAGVLVSRPGGAGQLALTVKAGGNGPHSHNDIGSFAIGLGSTQPVGDPGGPFFYNASTFTSRRFESRLLNSWGHPVPAIGGALQLEATAVRPAILGKQFSAGQDVIAIDLTKAYDSPGLRRAVRTVTYSRGGEGSICVEDEFDLARPTMIEESLPTHGTFRQIDSNTAEFSLGGQRLRMAIEAPSGLEFNRETVDEYGNPFTRIGVRVQMPGSGKVTMRFTPGR